MHKHHKHMAQEERGDAMERIEWNRMELNKQKEHLWFYRKSYSISNSLSFAAYTSPYAKLYARIKSSCNDVKVEKKRCFKWGTFSVSVIWYRDLILHLPKSRMCRCKNSERFHHTMHANTYTPKAQCVYWMEEKIDWFLFLDFHSASIIENKALWEKHYTHTHSQLTH